MISKDVGIIPACCSCTSSTGWHCGSTAGRKGEASGLGEGWEVWWFAPREENSHSTVDCDLFRISFKNI